MTGCFPILSRFSVLVASKLISHRHPGNLWVLHSVAHCHNFLFIYWYLLFVFGFAPVCFSAFFCQSCTLVALRAQAARMAVVCSKHLFARRLFCFTRFVMYWHFVGWDVRTPCQSLSIAVLRSCRWSKCKALMRSMSSDKLLLRFIQSMPASGWSDMIDIYRW